MSGSRQPRAAGPPYVRHDIVRESASDDVVETNPSPNGAVKVEVALPEPIPVPTMGFPAFRYKLNKRIGSPHRIPPIGKEELAAIAAEVDRLTLIALESRLKMLVRVVQVTIAVANGKGGASKSTDAGYIAAVIAEAARGTNIYLIPTTTNQDTSTAAINAGIDPVSTLTTTESVRDEAEIAQYRAMSRRIEKTKHGVSVISPPAASDVDIDDKFERDEFLLLYERIHANSDVIILDLGNDKADKSSVVLAAMEVGDVVLFAATADNPSTLELLSSTMARYISVKPTEEQITEPDVGQERSLVQIPVREKAQNSVVIFNKTAPEQNAQGFLPYTKQRDHHGNVTGDLGFVGDLLAVGYDDYIAHNVKVDLDKIAPATRAAFTNAAVTLIEKAAELQGIELPSRELVKFTGFKHFVPAPK